MTICTAWVVVWFSVNDQVWLGRLSFGGTWIYPYGGEPYNGMEALPNIKWQPLVPPTPPLYK